jgi:hypothetical protein
MPGFKVWLVVGIEGGLDARGVSNTSRWQVNHVKVPGARDSTMQDCCATAVRDPAGVAVKVTSIVAAVVQCRDGH